MKEDIEKMQDFIMLLRAEPEDNPKAFLEINYESQKELAQTIENLINKYKEQEKHIKALDSVIVEHIEKNKEQEKMIELMAKAFKQDDIRNEDEIIEYFRKEAKKEWETQRELMSFATN